ncbi:MAG: type II toxin-antitoxin system HicB family antitoxin [Acidobacteria bacterium]|nr:type II toxin-antitoxin system HicB family antitoxin [Acidobacteriota bacterium]
MHDTVELSVYLICTVKPEAGDRWVTGCPALDLFSQGETEEEAKRCLEEAIGLWIEDCLERGTLDEALQEVGFHRVHAATIRSGDEHVSASLPRETPDTFSVHLTIPAYQAAALLPAQA